jgi:hypothetical protein
LEIRRVLYTETKHSPINPAQLLRSKDNWFMRYTNFLSPIEFTKFVVLMHGLPPSLVMLVEPTNESRIQAANWQAVRENLELVLHGIPEATSLFLR